MTAVAPSSPIRRSARYGCPRSHGQTTLHGSDFVHHTYVGIEIYEAELRRDLARDWHFPRKPLIGIMMSEAQWATFVSSFGVGGGTPCTLDHVNCKMIPGFPLRDSGQIYKAEADAKLQGCIATIERAISEINSATSGLTKRKQAEVAGPLNRVLQELRSNLPFVSQSFGEHMEERVEKAKVEIEAHVGNAITRAGLKALREEDVRPFLELPSSGVKPE
jgi:hypothetical protein